MKLIAISRVKNELDIIEAFVRHHARYFNALIVLDDGSSDGTYELMQALQVAGLPLVLIRDPSVGYDQSRYMTRLLRMAVDQFGADWIMPLDADEFIEPGQGATLAQVLHSREPELLKVSWSDFLWRREDDEDAEHNPVLRLRFRMSPSPYSKVLVPARLVADGVAELAPGNHELLRHGKALPAERLSAVALCHFPIRTVAQYASKVAIAYLQSSAMPHWDRLRCFHYIEPYRLLTEGLDQLAESMPADSRRYSFEESWPGAGEPSETPLHYVGGPLELTVKRESVLANVLHCAAAISDELAERSRQLELAQHTLLAARALPTDVTAQTRAEEAAARSAGFETPPSKANRSRCTAGPAARHQASLGLEPAAAKHRFQSFWSGGALTPYESFCLKSFIDCGHAFDLYTYNTDVCVPTGVRLCDAAELFSPGEFFVYEDGFGKGSPSAFSNWFRYKLLAEKGGWWVDTDVVCLATDIPAFREFFSREDVDLINCAVLFFEPDHPLMVRCLEEAMKLGRSVRWGDAGPRLFTKVIEELGYGDRALANGTCYPVHYSEAADVLRPSKSAIVSQRTAASLFVHLWNSILHHAGVQKTNLPPKDSMLRQWIEQHPVDGWRGEYDEETLEQALLMQTELRTRGEQNNRLTAELATSVTERERLATDLATGGAEIGRLNAAMHAEREELVRNNERLKRELDVSTRENECRRAETEAILNSTCWRLTAPVRLIRRHLA